MRYLKILPGLLLLGLLCSPALSFSQVSPKLPPVTTVSPVAPVDTLTDVEILGSRHLTILKLNDSTTLQILAGNVRLRQGKSLFNCDSCVLNNDNKTFEAWGKVHINDADTINVYANHLRYLIDRKIAYLDGAVKLTDGKGTLTTPDLEYDMSTDIGIYKNGGKVVNKTTTLTSKEGYYYAGLRDIYFKNNVELKDPSYFIKTDSLLYNTQSQTTQFIAETFIKDSSGRTIETKEGFYNMATGKAEFGQRPVIKDGKTTIIADKVAFNDSLGTSQAIGNVVIVDTAQGTTILAGEVYRDNKRDRMLATRKPLMIIKQDNDSIYVTADTLFSARLSDLYGTKDSLVKDTIKGTKVVNVNKKDSTDRYFEAYRYVRIFADSMQAVQPSEAARRRGKLRIFLGYAAGVGKTYAMLDAALQDQANGVDVVVAYIDTHGQGDTEFLTSGLERVPSRPVEHGGVARSEMDLDALLARRPELALIDELAHQNSPGLRHPKRYQDVEELLDAGINVYTTLNVQHLESLNDVVA